MSNVSFVAAFTAGMVSFLSPCVLPLVPAYLSMVTGVSVAELQERDSLQQQRKTVLRGILLFVAGFTVVFVTFGAGAGLVGTFLTRNQRIFEIVSGLLLIGFGIFLAGIVRPGWLERERRFRIESSLGGWAAPVIGMAFAFGWTPCIGPILGAVMTIAAQQGGVGRGSLLLLVYAAGLAVPFVLAGMALSEMSRLFGWVKRHFRLINGIAGAIMIAFGLLLVFGKVQQLSIWITRFLSSIGLEGLTTS